jgi:phage tail tape-measure protein
MSSEPFRPSPSALPTPKEPEEVDERPSGVPARHQHATTEAAVLSGAVAGAIVGAIGGPLGAMAGGAIGSAIGAMAGATLERAEHLREVHDHELDDEIGVTSGSLGVPKEAKQPSAEALQEAREADEARKR